MNALRQALADYLAVRRVLGYKLVRAEKLLAQFLTYVEDRGEAHLTTESALAWATLPPEAHRSWSSTRLSIVRCFAVHLRGIDPATEVPPVDLLPGQTLPLFGRRDFRPYHSGWHIAHATPSGDLSDFDRPAGSDRNAGWGSNQPRPQRFRCGQRPAHHPPWKVRQVARAAVASEYCGRSSSLSDLTRRGLRS